MALFGKSFDERVQAAVETVRGKVPGLTRLVARVDGKTVTLEGEADSIAAKGQAMSAFNELVETENTFNKIHVPAQPPAGPAAQPVAAAAPGTGGVPGAGGASAAAARVHEVKPGDTLSAIAKHYYGKASLYPKIFDANRDVLDDPNKIKPGQKLRIPD